MKKEKIDKFEASIDVLEEIHKNGLIDNQSTQFIQIIEPKPIYRSVPDLVQIDFSSVRPWFKIEKETSSIPDFFEKDIRDDHSFEIKLAKAMLKYDVIGLMPPVEKKTIKLKITKIRKGELKTEL